MENEVPKLDVPTLEYIISMLETEIEASGNCFNQTDVPAMRIRYRAFGTHAIYLKNELKTLIEAQQEGSQNGD